MKAIKTVGVIGAGTMGAAIAQKFAQEGFNVILNDRSMTFIERGMASLRKSLSEGVERKVFTEHQSQEILGRVHGSDLGSDLEPCDLVVEAIFEDLEVKKAMFARLSTVVRPDAIIATNTSSFSVSELARSVSNRERFCGLHFFYHAAKNRLVEIIPGIDTSKETIEALKRFAFETGKDAIVCSDMPGFAVNRFFVPWLNEAARLLEEGIAGNNLATATGAIDAICMSTFQIGMGPFALMNATGVPIAYHSERTLESLGEAYKVSNILRDQASSNAPWEIAAVPASLTPNAEQSIRDRMLGIVFFVCGEILSEHICSSAELNRGARIGLAWRKGPIDLMQEFGTAEVDRFVRAIAERYHSLVPQGLAGAFEPMQFVRLDQNDKTAVITFERAEDLNALNETVVSQLAACFDKVDQDPNIEQIVITGSGKAFVAGADIGFFVKNIRSGSINRIVSFTEQAQQIFDRIDRSQKRIVALLNGLTLGGGLELALCADEIYALPSAQLSFPETGIGIYPGLGGTQRTALRTGRGIAKYLIFTGDMLKASDAAKIGLVDRVISNDEYFDMLSGKLPAHPVRETAKLSHPWNSIGQLFTEVSVMKLLGIEPIADGLFSEDIERLRKRVRQKAPIALRTAERLVDEARGCASELEFLPNVFQTDDALLGLSSIGKKVTFRGS